MRDRVAQVISLQALSLAHGFFKIKTQSTRYLMARQNGAVVGGLGFTHDPIDQKVRIFELIGIHDQIKGKLLGKAEQIAREDLNAFYIEADVISLEESQTVEIRCTDLMRLMNKRPRLGSVVMRNLAGDLSEKLRKIDARMSQSEAGK